MVAEEREMRGEKGHDRPQPSEENYGEAASPSCQPRPSEEGQQKHSGVRGQPLTAQRAVLGPASCDDSLGFDMEADGLIVHGFKAVGGEQEEHERKHDQREATNACEPRFPVCPRHPLQPVPVG